MKEVLKEAVEPLDQAQQFSSDNVSLTKTKDLKELKKLLIKQSLTTEKISQKLNISSEKVVEIVKRLSQRKDLLEKAKSRAKWAAMGLPSFSVVGTSISHDELLAAKFRISREQVAAMHERMTADGEREGIRYMFDRVRMENSFDAHRLIHFAAGEGLRLGGGLWDVLPCLGLAAALFAVEFAAALALAVGEGGRLLAAGFHGAGGLVGGLAARDAQLDRLARGARDRGLRLFDLGG
mgnify:CR=1 FL=1